MIKYAAKAGLGILETKDFVDKDVGSAVYSLYVLG
jgi:hypothetical protein